MTFPKSLALAVAGVFLSASYAAAQSPTPSAAPTPQNRFPRVWNAGRRSAAERIAERMQAIVNRRTAAYEKLLEQLYRILDRISAAADRRDARGADVQDAREAIIAARRALDDARAAVRDLASKEYIFDGATDLTVADLLRAARQELEDDLKGVHAKLRSGHQALREAVRELNRAHIPPASDEQN